MVQGTPVFRERSQRNWRTTNGSTAQTVTQCFASSPAEYTRVALRSDKSSILSRRSQTGLEDVKAGKHLNDVILEAYQESARNREYLQCAS